MRNCCLSLVGRTAVATALLLMTLPAQAQRQEDFAKVEKLYAEGSVLFGKGQYKAALDRFNGAYAIYPAANLLFNIGRAYQALGKVHMAIVYYKRFLARTGIDPRTKVEAERRKSDLETAKHASAPVPTGTEGSLAPASAKRDAAQHGAKAVTPADEPSPYSPWQWIAFGAGGALVAGGIVAAVLGLQDGSKADKWETSGFVNDDGVRVTQQEVDDLRSSGSLKKIIGFSLVGVGGAAIATGAVLLTLQMTSSGETKKKVAKRTAMTFGMSPLPGGGGAMLRGTF